MSSDLSAYSVFNASQETFVICIYSDRARCSLDLYVGTLEVILGLETLCFKLLF